MVRRGSGISSGIGRVQDVGRWRYIDMGRMWRSRCSRQIERRTNAKHSDGATARDETLAKSGHDRDDPLLKQKPSPVLLSLYHGSEQYTFRHTHHSHRATRDIVSPCICLYAKLHTRDCCTDHRPQDICDVRRTSQPHICQMYRPRISLRDIHN
jgi:hypothetical protein